MEIKTGLKKITIPRRLALALSAAVISLTGCMDSPNGQNPDNSQTQQIEHSDSTGQAISSLERYGFIVPTSLEVIPNVQIPAEEGIIYQLETKYGRMLLKNQHGFIHYTLPGENGFQQGPMVDSFGPFAPTTGITLVRLPGQNNTFLAVARVEDYLTVAIAQVIPVTNVPEQNNTPIEPELINSTPLEYLTAEHFYTFDGLGFTVGVKNVEGKLQVTQYDSSGYSTYSTEMSFNNPAIRATETKLFGDNGSAIILSVENGTDSLSVSKISPYTYR